MAVEEPAASAAPAPPAKLRVGLPPHPQFAGWASQASVASPTGYSPSPSPRWSVSPHRYSSPGFADADPHGGFNPNVTFPHPPPAMYASPGYSTSPSLRRALPFAPQQDPRLLFGGMHADSFMEEIITTGSMATAACPGFLSQGGEFFSQSGGESGGSGGSGGGEAAEEGAAADPAVVDEGGAPAKGTKPAAGGPRRCRRRRSLPSSRASSGR